jgi:hypothetical protein
MTKENRIESHLIAISFLAYVAVVIYASNTGNDLARALATVQIYRKILAAIDLYREIKGYKK